MSRLGKIPVSIPKDAKIKVENGQIQAEGPKGKISLLLPVNITLETKEDKIFVKRSADEKQDRANHGTTRARLVNMLKGVTVGHKINLEIQGVGFRAQVDGQKLVMTLGFSHPVQYMIPEGVKVKTSKPTEIEVEGVDNVLVGEVAANIRRFKRPEPYKGKGIRYVGEFVRRKQGKQVTK